MHEGLLRNASMCVRVSLLRAEAQNVHMDLGVFVCVCLVNAADSQLQVS